MKEMVHFERGSGRRSAGASAPQNVVFPMVLEPRDSKMLYFLSFWSLEILKCCILLVFGTSRFGNGSFLVVLEPRDLKMLYFFSFWSLEILKCWGLEIWECCISCGFGA